ncbi:hypothetical protein L1987_01604 [Smallanthus sonchifolius]|uniref:Uncharacterized protein n=1 Tax=Smallanthus sonchifolius TaxID=185202 RepID=A0ACB9K5H8_9ASTR|nr:hypothetical protein L1987_01604 [Smallanthus sonchifolius]
MHLDTIGFLLEAINDDSKSNPDSVDQTSDEGAVVNLLVNAISAKHYALENILEALSQAARDTVEVFALPFMFIFEVIINNRDTNMACIHLYVYNPPHIDRLFHIQSALFDLVERRKDASL